MHYIYMDLRGYVKFAVPKPCKIYVHPPTRQDQPRMKPGLIPGPQLFIHFNCLVCGPLPRKRGGMPNSEPAHIIMRISLFARPRNGIGQALSSPGSSKMAASPPASGREAAFELTTGVPQAMASRTGSPNPSYK